MALPDWIQDCKERSDALFSRQTNDHKPSQKEAADLWNEHGGDLIRKIELLLKQIDLQPKTEEGIPIIEGDITYCDDASPMSHQWRMRLRNGETLEEHKKSCSEKHYKSIKAARRRHET